MIFEPILSALGAYGEVGRGRIVGGWGYVWVSYALTWTTLGLYALSLLVRRRSLTKQLENP